MLDLLHHLVTLSVCPEKNRPEEERLEERFIEDMYEKVKGEIFPPTDEILLPIAVNSSEVEVEVE